MTAKYQSRSVVLFERRRTERPKNVCEPNPAGIMRAPGSLCAISPHLQQENSPYSICAGQISEAAQFIKANYRHKALEVISARRSQTYAVRQGCCLRAAPRKQRPHSSASQETGWSELRDSGQRRSVRVGPVRVGPSYAAAISLTSLPKITETCWRSACLPNPLK